MSDYGRGNPWSDFRRRVRKQSDASHPSMPTSLVRNTPSSSQQQQQRQSRMLPLGSTGVSVPINVQSSASPPPSRGMMSPPLHASPSMAQHPYRMSSRTYADLSRSRSNSVQSLPRDELSDSSLGSSPPSGRVTPTPHWLNGSHLPGEQPPMMPHPSSRATRYHHLAAVRNHHDGQDDEEGPDPYTPKSGGFRVSMDPASSAPSRRDTWASSISGSHHGHGHSNSSPPPPLPVNKHHFDSSTYSSRFGDVPRDEEHSFLSSSLRSGSNAAGGPPPVNSLASSSQQPQQKPELPTLKLDLDFGSGGLMDDFSFGSLGLGEGLGLGGGPSSSSNSAEPASNAQDNNNTAGRRESTNTVRDESRREEATTPLTATASKHASRDFSPVRSRGTSFIDADSSPSSSRTTHANTSADLEHMMATAPSEHQTLDPSASTTLGEGTSSSATTPVTSTASLRPPSPSNVALPDSRPDSRLSELDSLGSSRDSLAMSQHTVESRLPPGAAPVPPHRNSSGRHAVHSRHSSTSSHAVVREPPPRGSSMRSGSFSEQDGFSRDYAQHQRNSKDSVGSNGLVASMNQSKVSLHSPTSPTQRSIVSAARSSTPDTTPSPSHLHAAAHNQQQSQQPPQHPALSRPLSHLALNKNLPPPPPPGAAPAPTQQQPQQQTYMSSSNPLGRMLMRKSSAHTLDEYPQERPSTAPQIPSQVATSSPPRKGSLPGSAAANHLLNRSKGFLHRSTSAVPLGAPVALEQNNPHQHVNLVPTADADKAQRTTRSSFASYFNAPQRSHSLEANTNGAAGGSAGDVKPPHRPSWTNRRGSSTSSEEGQAAHMISLSTARRSEERKVEQQKHHLVRQQEEAERERDIAKKMEAFKSRHVSSKPPPPVDLNEASSRPSTDKLLELASAKLAQFAVAEADLEAASSKRSSHLSTTDSEDQAADDEAVSYGQAVRVTRLAPKSQADSASAAGDRASVSSAAAQEAELQRRSQQPAFVLSNPPKVIERRQALADAEKTLAGTATQRSPTTPNHNPEHAADSMLDVRKQAELPTPGLTSPMKNHPSSGPRTPQPPPLLWEKRRLPYESVDRQDATSWIVLEEAYEQYADAIDSAQQDRHAIVQQSLLPFLKALETGEERIADHPVEARRQREALFKWMDVLTEELHGVPANRGTCLDGVAATLESVAFSPEALAQDPPSSVRFHDTLVAILSFAIEKLNEKAVYANTLSFSGRLLATAFFRIEGVGKNLLRLLPPVKRMDLKRILNESGVGAFGRTQPPLRMDIFPEHLTELCFQNLHSYSTMLQPLAPADDAVLVESKEHSVRMHGNWLIRWQASDSDLPFAFYRAYHRQLAAYLHPPDSLEGEAYVSPYEAISAPGFLFIAASLLEKVDSLIHRNLRSVTTLGPGNNNFSSNDSANMSMGTKPKVLEHLNRRVVSTIQDIVGGPARPQPDPEPSSYDGLGRRRFFGGMLQVWLRALVKRTSLYDARGVFLLLDFIEGLFYTVCTQVPPPGSEPGPWHPSQDALILFDVPFILSFVKTLVIKADNTIAIMRTITFLYSQFETFTLRANDRYELCQKILLYPDTFQRMFLFWNVSVRGYFLRLLVWRVSRLGTSPDGKPMDIKDPQIIAILQTLNSRLEGLRKRHDEIDPLDDLPDDGLFDASRASVSSTRGVTNQSWFSEELVEGRVFDFDDDEYDSDSLSSSDDTVQSGTPDLVSSSGRSTSTPESTAPVTKGPPRENVKISKVVNWLKVLKPNKRQTSADDKPARFGTINEPFSVASGHKKTPSSSSLQEIAPTPADDEPPPAVPRKPVNTPPLSEQDDQQEQEPFPLVGNPAGSDNNFFQFEFESSTPVSDTFDSKSKRSTKAGSVKTKRSSRTSVAHGRASSSRRGSMSQSPRVSKRFSKRASILPPPALDLLLESSEPVPQIPKEFQNPPPYQQHQHPYAVRALREYEDALDEFDVWIARVQEDEPELEGREQSELIPRLSLLWPLSFSESD